MQYFKIFGIGCFVQVQCCDTFLVLKYWISPGVALQKCRHLLNTHKITVLFLLRNLLFYQSTSLIPSVLICRCYIFRVGVGEAKELVLVQVHDDELVRRRQIHGHLGELLVKVAGVSTVPLQVAFKECEGGMGERSEENER